MEGLNGSGGFGLIEDVNFPEAPHINGSKRTQKVFVSPSQAVSVATAPLYLHRNVGEVVR